MGAPIIWTAAWAGSRLITPRLIASGSAAAGRVFGAEMGASISGVLNNFIVRNVIGAEVQHALRHLMRGGVALAKHGDVVEAEKEVEFAFRINDDEVKQDLKDANSFVAQEANGESIEEAAEHLADRIREKVPVRTGGLRGSVGYRRDYRTGNILVGYGIRYRTRIAHLVEYGTKPHPITLKEFRRGRAPAKVLSDGQTTFGRRVKRHPGTKGKYIIQSSLQGEQVRVIDTYKVALNRKLREQYGS